MTSDQGPHTTDEARLPTGVWVDAHLRRLNAAGTPYYVVQTGAWAAGTVMLKITTPGRTCRVLQQHRDPSGKQGWMTLLDAQGKEGESQADALIARACARDPDLWVLEIEDRDGTNPFEGKEI